MIKGLSPKYVYPSSIEDTFKVIQNLQLCMTTILDCTLSEDLIDNSSSLNAVSMILKDSMLCYKLLSDGIIKCLDIFFKMDSKNAKEALSIYEKHLQQTTKLIAYYGIAKKLNGIVGSKLPSLTPPPDTFLKQMKKYSEDPKSFLKEETEKEDKDMVPQQDISNLINDEDISKDLWKDEKIVSPRRDDLSDIFEDKKEKKVFNRKLSNPQDDNPFETKSDPFESDPFTSDPFQKNVQNNNGKNPFEDPFSQEDPFQKPIVVVQKPIVVVQKKIDPNIFTTLEPTRPGQKEVPKVNTIPQNKPQDQKKK